MIAEKFISLHPKVFKRHDKSYKIDDIKKTEQVIFSNEFVQKAFTNWLKKES